MKHLNQEQLIAILYQLDDNQDSAQHLEQCQHCQGELEKLKQTFAMLDVLKDEPNLSQSLIDDTVIAIASPPRRWILLKAILTLAALFMVVFSINVFYDSDNAIIEKDESVAMKQEIEIAKAAEPEALVMQDRANDEVLQQQPARPMMMAARAMSVDMASEKIIKEPLLISQKKINQKYDSDGNLIGYDEVKVFRFKLDNPGTEKISEVIVREFDTENWKIQNKGDYGQYEKIDARTVSYTIEIPAGGSIEFEYEITIFR